MSDSWRPSVLWVGTFESYSSQRLDPTGILALEDLSELPARLDVARARAEGLPEPARTEALKALLILEREYEAQAANLERRRRG